MPNNNKLVVLVGPTAVGKTKMSLELASKYHGEIVCADSRTIYKGMDIGTAKPSQEEQDQIRHYLLDIVEPDTSFSVAEYKELAQKAIKDIQSRGKLPFLVGLSGLYVDAVLFDYQFRNATDTSSLVVTQLSMAELQEQAKEKYPKEYQNIDSHNRRRLEQLLTKGPAKDDDRNELKVPCLLLGMAIKSPILKQNIANRTKSMLNNGFIQEVEDLYRQYGANDVLLQTTGYAQVLAYLQNNIDYSELEESINNATYQLSRKQMTWYRRNPHIQWITNIQQATKLIDNYLQDMAQAV